MKEYGTTKLHYGFWRRHRDNRNARRDRRNGGVIYYRRYKTTKYLGVVKSEAQVFLNQEQQKYNSAQAEVHGRLQRQDSELQSAKNELDDLNAQLEELNNTLDAARRSGDYVRCATSERRISDLAPVIDRAEEHLRKSTNDHRAIEDEAVHIEQVYRENCAAIKLWEEMRCREYVDVLFKKADAVQERMMPSPTRSQKASATSKLPSRRKEK